MTAANTMSSTVAPPTPAVPVPQVTKTAKPAKPVAATKVAKDDAKPTKKAVSKKVPTPKATVSPKPTQAAVAVKPGKANDTKESKTKKPKLVRDSFTIPKDEYAVLDTLKQRATILAHPVKKSELLRAGLKVLAGLSDSALRSALQAVPSIKTGRPKAEAAETPPTATAKTVIKAGGKNGRK